MTSDLESPRRSADGNLVILFFRKTIELWAKNRILEADLFAFDRDTHPYDFKLVGDKRLIWSIRSGDIFFCDTNEACYGRGAPLFF